MRIFKRVTAGVAALSMLFSLVGPIAASAATTPSLGAAATFAVLADTFTRNVGLTALTGDLGYTTLSGGGTHSVTGGVTHVADGTYASAGTDQGTALTSLAAQTCDFSFGSPTDLSLLSQPLAPGVYCISAATSIGTGGITLSGAGTYIFRITGALTTVNNSNVTLTNGASSCNVFWTPTAATTLGANTTFVGTDIDASGITVGSTTAWTGRALAFGGTVTADTDSINATCVTTAQNPPPGQQGTLTVVKRVINDNGGTKGISSFPLNVSGNGQSTVVSGQPNNFPASVTAYVVTETNTSGYTQVFSGDCNAAGQVTLSANDNKVCILTNDDIGAPVVPPVPPLIEVVKVPNPLALPSGPGPVTYTYTLRNIGTVPVTDITMVGDTCSPIVRVSGDTDGDNQLDVTETWVHTCTTNLTQTHTNTVVATGQANGLTATDIASATVVVGLPIIPPLIHVTKVPSPLTLPAGGGSVTYTKKVTNPGTVPLSNVRLTDDKCSPVAMVGGDANLDGKLDPSETWTYTCTTTLAATTTNTVVALGDANGQTARDIALATVIVAAAPALPKTGIGSTGSAIAWAVGAFSLLAASFVLNAFRKRRA